MWVGTGPPSPICPHGTNPWQPCPASHPHGDITDSWGHAFSGPVEGLVQMPTHTLSPDPLNPALKLAGHTATTHTHTHAHLTRSLTRATCTAPRPQQGPRTREHSMDAGPHEPHAAPQGPRASQQLVHMLTSSHKPSPPLTAEPLQPLHTHRPPHTGTHATSRPWLWPTSQYRPSLQLGSPEGWVSPSSCPLGLREGHGRREVGPAEGRVAI